MKFNKSILAATVASLLTAVVVAQGQVPGVNSTLTAAFNLVYDNSTMKPTYSASSQFIPASAATDVCYLTGSATKTIKVRRVIVAGLASVVQSEPVAIVKRSTATTGAGVAMSKVPYDSQNSLTSSTTNTATATADIYTANPTVGTLVGVLADLYITWGNLTTGVGGTLSHSFGTLGSPIVLRGVAQQVAVNLNAQTLVTGLISCTFEWTEE